MEEYLAQNIAWWRESESKHSTHPARIMGYDRAEILEGNPRFREETLVRLNSLVITLDSQDGSCGEEDSTVFPEFIQQQVDKLHLPAGFPKVGVVGREMQRPYVEFVATPAQVTRLRRHLGRRYALLVATNGRIPVANPLATAEAAATGHLGLTKVELRAAGGQTSECVPTRIRLDRRYDQWPWIPRGARIVIIVDLCWGADGDALLSAITCVLA